MNNKQFLHISFPNITIGKLYVIDVSKKGNY